MWRRIYPRDQIEKYLIIDMLVVVVFIYHVFIASHSIPLVGRIAAFLLFLGSFYVGLWYRDWRLLGASLVWCSLMTVLGLYIDNWMLLYGFVFADLLGRTKRLWVMAGGMAGIVIMYLAHSWLDAGSPFALFTNLFFAGMIMQLTATIVVHTKEKTRQLKAKLDIVSEQLEHYIQEEERNRIARDLHDTLGQTLTMIKLKSELTIRLVDMHPEKAKHELNDILDTSRYALKQVRELVTDMRFVSLAKEIARSRELLRDADIDMSVMEEGLRPLSNSAETMVALSIREAVTNIIKHSEATRCTLAHYVQGEHYYIQVIDNGKGLDQQGHGNGLQSMRERMAMLQGDAYITANPDKGAVVTLKLPLMNNGRG
ncbi:sensor histidine kinase [Paenibacillus sp. 1011MAR3C5]|uniref:sensor histidine kinase n=1 Tax=Paenibacillus sp. 1011MAR3C5 TaxID=1675787 RepID=UPI000E6B6097|nr:sensor histidine kinase [Paenibacillus sp. 1011MAR3C5]RJE88416.1 sensor histidine kinase [Paenibacillus sp. 1011MAR3C5]